MITVSPKRKPVELTSLGEGYIYRGFRLVPNYVSTSTGRPINSPKGWTCPDFRREGMSGYAWYATLADFAEDIDDCYALAAEGKARNDRKAALGRACENLHPDEAAQVRALVAECNRKQAEAEVERRAAQAAQDAEHEARRRLHNAAPDLLAALQMFDRWPAAHQQDGLKAAFAAARAAIAAATGEEHTTCGK